MTDLDRAQQFLAPALVDELRAERRELAALRELERAVRVHDHGKSCAYASGRSCYPCSLCDELSRLDQLRQAA